MRLLPSPPTQGSHASRDVISIGPPVFLPFTASHPRAPPIDTHLNAANAPGRKGRAAASAG